MSNLKSSSILLVEDEESIRTLLIAAFRQYNYTIVTAGSRLEALGCIANQEFDLIIADKNLPDGSGLDVIDEANKAGHSSEKIIITAYSDTDSAIHAVSLGVFRYVRKPFDLKGLLLDVSKALETKRLRHDLARRTTELETTNKALMESEQRYRMLFNSGNDAVFVYPISPDGNPGKFIEINDVACNWLGYSHDELLNFAIVDLNKPDSKSKFLSRMKQLLEKRHVLYELTLLSRDNQPIPVEVSSRLFELSGRLTVLDVVRDITERRRNEEERIQLENQFREAQKMEAVGRLAGGVAHDINNVLGAIMGLTSAWETVTKKDNPCRQDQKAILRACRKGQNLTIDLLGFARKGKYLTERLSFNEMANEIKDMLSRTIPKTIDVKTALDDNLAYLEGDSTQLKHAIMNICVNGIDAMNNNGTLQFTTRNAVISKDDTGNYPDLAPGPYVALDIQDTGTGMSRDTLERVFEPFFTTKPQGKGSGLGLSMVYGTIKNHKGGVYIETEIGKGTSVHILLPKLMSPKKELQPKQKMPEASPNKNGRTVLLVDDEEIIRRAGKRLLERLGCTVFLAQNGEDAVNVFKKEKDNIWLVMLDMTMPVMDGEEAFHKIQSISPEAKVLLSSGYSKEEKAEELLGAGAAGFIQKPFDLKSLSETLETLK